MNGFKAAIAHRWRDFRPGRGTPRIAVAGQPRPRLFADVSVIIRHDAQTGIQRVVRAVWNQLRERAGDKFDVVPVFATGRHAYRSTTLDFLDLPSNLRPPGRSILVQPGDKFLGLDLTAHLLPTYKRQISSWRSQGVTTHIVVYDLLPLQRPDWFNEKTARNFRRWIEVVRDHADQALCISDQVAGDLRRYLGPRAEPEIGRVRMAGDIEASLPSRGIDASVAKVIARVLSAPAILMVGTIEPRKAYDVALAAFDHLWKSRGPEAPILVIVGKPGWRTDALQKMIISHPEQGNRLFWLTDVSDEGLGRLYESCSGVFLASRAEGFGLPVIEAAMHGRRALVRDLPVFREQNLPNCSYFIDDSATGLARMLMDLIQSSDPPIGKMMLPTWDSCVTDVLAQMGFAETVARPVSAQQIARPHDASRPHSLMERTSE